MAHRRHQRTTKQGQQDALLKRQRTSLDKGNAKAEQSLRQSFYSAHAPPVMDSASDEARDMLISEMVTVLNATVRHEAALARDVKALRDAEEKLESEVSEVSADQVRVFSVVFFKNN